MTSPKRRCTCISIKIVAWKTRLRRAALCQSRYCRTRGTSWTCGLHALAQAPYTRRYQYTCPCRRTSTQRSMIVWKSRVLLRHKHPRPRSRHIPLNRQRAHSSFRQGATRSGVLPNCVRHHPVFGNSRRRAHTQNSRFCRHFSRMIAGIFRSLPRDIASRAEFGASVSGAKNPVPNSIWAASAWHEVHGLIAN